jgi:hypothetical protein
MGHVRGEESNRRNSLCVRGGQRWCPVFREQDGVNATTGHFILLGWLMTVAGRELGCIRCFLRIPAGLSDTGHQALGVCKNQQNPKEDLL